MSHTLEKRAETETYVVYYTCPAKAIRYTDTAGILAPYDGVLAEFASIKRWSLIFDSAGFSFQHLLEVNTTIGLARLFSDKYGSTLKDIRIVNPTWYIKAAYGIVTPFLSESVRSKVLIQ